MVNLKFLSKMQVTFDKQILGLIKSNEKGDFIDGSQGERCKDGLLTKRRHSENIICGCQNNVRKYRSEIKNMEMCIKLSQQLTQNTIDERSLVSALVTTTCPKDGVQIKHKTRIDSASKYTLKRTKNIKREVCTKCKEILKHIDRFLNNNNDTKDARPLQKLTESDPHNSVTLNNHSINLDIVNEQKKTCVDDKQNGQTNISCQSASRLDKFRRGISLNCNKSTSNVKHPNNKNNDENQIEQIVSSNRTFERDNFIVACNKPVCSKFNTDAMCYFVDLDNTCTSNLCPDRCGPPKAKPKRFCFRKKVDVGIDTDCCLKRSLYNKIGNFFSCITTKFRSRQNNQNIECGTPLKDARNQTKKLTINIKKEPVCIIFENASKQSCKNKSPNEFGKLPKKKVAFRDKCVNLPKGLVAIKIDPNNKRIINKRELKSILKSLPKKEIKNCPIPSSTSKVEVTTLLKPKSSPIASACKGPMFVLKIDRNNMRILNYQEVKCKINNLNKMCAKNPNCESWIVTKGKCQDKKQELRSVESKMSLWDRYHRSKSKSPCPPIKKKPSQGKLDGKPCKKSISELFSKVKRCVQKKPRSKSGSIVTKYVRGNKRKKPKKKVAPKKKIVKKRSRTPAKKPKRPKRKTKQKTVLHKKGLKKKKSSKRKNKKKKGKTRRRMKKSKRVFKKCCLLFKTEAECKRKKKKSAKLKRKKSKSKPLDCKNIDKPKGRERKLEKTQYDYLRHTKTPCLWLFVACPLLHRNYMMFRSIFHDFTRCMLLMLALIFWCPCFLCIELFRCFCT